MKIISLFLISFLIIKKGNAQTAFRDFDSTSMSIIGKVFKKSESTVVPINVINDLKKYAAEKGLKESHVMKNLISVRPLFNKDLEKAEKRLFLEWAIQLYSSENIMIPVSYFTEALKKL